jgi:hypothetical protein
MHLFGFNSKRVLSLDYFVITKYKMKPFSNWNGFFGTGIGMLGALFVAPEDFVFDSDLGFALLIGLEPYLGNSSHMNFELKWTFGISEFKPRGIRTTSFEGGKVGGIQLTIGYGFNW